MKISIALVFAAVLTLIGAAQDTQLNALKDTLFSLCSANKDGKFGACCIASNNGQDITKLTSIPSCFGTYSVSDGNLVSMFASQTPPFFAF